MEIKRHFIEGDGFHVPCVLLTPPRPAGATGATGAALIVHGYGGSKEEFLGLAWRVAETGLATCVIDLRGHGEHMLPLNEDVLRDVEAAVGFCRRYGRVIAVGHSMGGRLALLSSADAVIAISPAYSKTYCAQTHSYIHRMESHRVREPSTETVFEILEKLPLWRPGNGRPVSIIYGSRDNYDTVQSCEELKAAGVPVRLIDKALHGDSFLFEATFQAIKNEVAKFS